MTFPLIVVVYAMLTPVVVIGGVAAMAYVLRDPAPVALAMSGVLAAMGAVLVGAWVVRRRLLAADEARRPGDDCGDAGRAASSAPAGARGGGD